MIEPTETETVETLDAFADALIATIAAGSHETPELVTGAPHGAPVRRLDEATAARRPDLRWRSDDREPRPRAPTESERESKTYERLLGSKLTVR